MNQQTKALLFFIMTVTAILAGLTTIGWYELTMDIPFFNNLSARGFVAGVTATAFLATYFPAKAVLRPVPIPIDTRPRRRR